MIEKHLTDREKNAVLTLLVLAGVTAIVQIFDGEATSFANRYFFSLLSGSLALLIVVIGYVRLLKNKLKKKQ